MADEADIKDGEEQNPNWVSPELYQPRPGATVVPGFLVSAFMEVINPSKWQLKIMEGDKQLYFLEESSRQHFDHHVKLDAIKPGTKFDVHVHYYHFPAWSEWASVYGMVMADPKPVITEPVQGAVTGKRPRFAGRGLPGATINLYQAYSGTVLFGTATVDENFNWQITPDVDLFDGPLQLVVNQKNSNSEYWSDNVRIIVGDPKPVITEPVAGAMTGPRPRFAGRGIPGATITLYQENSDMVRFGTAVVDANGNWQITPVVDLFEGPLRLVVTQIIFDTEYWSDNVRITVAGNKPVITEPAAGAITGPRPIVAGRGIPGTTIKLYQANSGTVLFGTAVVNLNGDWRIIPVVDLFEGPFQLVVNQTITNTEYWSDNVSITVRIFRAPPPVIKSPENGAIVKTDKPMIHGSGYTGAVVKLYQANGGDTVFGTAVAGWNGDWSISPTVAFPKGRFTLTANQAVDSRPSDWADVVTFTIDV
jgi:hypothetical protein